MSLETSDRILDLLTTATSDTNNAVDDASAITLVNAALDYNVRSSISNTLRPSVSSTTLQTIVTDSDNIANELNTDINDLTDALIKYYNTLEDKAPDFLVPSQKSAIVASGTALKNGAQSFLNSVAGITTDPDLDGAEEGQIANVVDAFDDFTDAYGDGV
ncbi:MAG: hypothetical protein ASARMPRED_002418 [Alectoria sarmentosa]|nr:MAG: hypothetical protein ASARMPRED_002418 [Alectoria sarmentosa]